MRHIVNGELEGVIQRPARSKGGSINPRVIVIHDTAGRLRKFNSRDYLVSNDRGVSVQFVVERDGTISQLVPCGVKAFHAGRSTYKGRSNVNAFSIGIEIVNPGRLERFNDRESQAWYGARYNNEDMGITFKNTREHGSGMWMPYTEEQIDSVIEICESCVGAYNIKDIVPHWFISPGRKFDTNPLFPLEYLRSRVFSRNQTKMGGSTVTSFLGM